MKKIKPWVTQYGPDPDSWNLGEDMDDGDGSNNPGVNVVAEVIGFYLAKNPSADRSPEALADMICIPVDMVQPALALDCQAEPFDAKNAILNWVSLRGNGDTTVAEISMVFMLEPAVVMQHVIDGYWSYLDGDIESGDPTKITVELEGV